MVPSGMNKLFSPRSWSVKTRILVPVFFVLFLCIVVFGLDTVTGLALGLADMTVLILVLTRRWRRIRNYLFLAGGALLGAIILSGIYMEIAVPLALRVGGQGALDSTPWHIFQGIVSDGMILVGASAIVVGIFGAIVVGVTRAWKEFRTPATS
jgi:hypothetical protein